MLAQNLEAFREMLEERVGMTWTYCPLLHPIPSHWHIEKFVDDDGLVEHLLDDAHFSVSRRRIPSDSSHKGDGQDGGVVKGEGASVWSRGIAEGVAASDTLRGVPKGEAARDCSHHQSDLSREESSESETKGMCIGRSMWVRSLVSGGAGPLSSCRKKGHNQQSYVHGREDASHGPHVTFDLGGSLGLARLPPLHVGCGNLKSVCLKTVD